MKPTETKTDQVRALLAEGRTVADIAEIVDMSPQRVRIVRWFIRNPDYRRVWAKRNREINRERDKARRQRLQTRRLIEAERARAKRQAEKVTAAIRGPAHWYG